MFAFIAKNRRGCFSRKMSEREEKLWNEFLQAIRDCNEDTVGKILLETRNLNLGGGKTNFLTRKITTTQVRINLIVSRVNKLCNVEGAFWTKNGNRVDIL